MNATTRDEIRQSAAVREPLDPKMDQIRELLVGDLVRQSEARMVAMEMRLRELEQRVTAGMDDLSRRIEALAGAADAKQRSGMEELARHVAALGESILRSSRT